MTATKKTSKIFRNKRTNKLGRKKHVYFFDIARPKSNVGAHLKQRKRYSGLSTGFVM